MAQQKNYAIEYGNFGRKKTPPDNFVTGETLKANRMQKRPNKKKPVYPR